MNKKEMKIIKFSTRQIIREIGELQTNITDEIGYIPESMIRFEHEEHEIINPFVDESGSHEVDPVSYYGDSFLNSEWKKYFKRLKEERKCK